MIKTVREHEISRSCQEEAESATTVERIVTGSHVDTPLSFYPSSKTCPGSSASSPGPTYSQKRDSYTRYPRFAYLEPSFLSAVQSGNLAMLVGCSIHIRIDLLQIGLLPIAPLPVRMES